MEAEPSHPTCRNAVSSIPDQFVTGDCHICSKPICPKCMELFGYVCSPLCRGKAEAKGIVDPGVCGAEVGAGGAEVAAGGRRRRRGWRAGRGGIGGMVLVCVDSASVPQTYWSVRFDEPAYSGQSAFCGKDQIVFIHGDTLARYDMKLKKEIWSRHLVDKKEIEAAIAREMKAMQAVIDKANSEDPDHAPKMPDPERSSGRARSGRRRRAWTFASAARISGFLSRANSRAMIATPAIR